MNAPFSPTRAAQREPFAAFLCDAPTQEVVRTAAASFGWPLERVQDGGLRNAVQTLATSASPAVLLVDLSDCADPLEEINGLAEVCEPGTIVITCGRANDVRLYRELIGSGIHDYLLKPFGEAQLQESIQQAQAHEAASHAHAATPDVPQLMVAVIGVRGGVGCTTVAVSTAWLMAEGRKRSTALLDLDIHFGTGALALDLEPGRGLTDAIENPQRIDGLFLERALVRASETLGVLSAETPINQPLTGDGAAFFQLQDELRTACSCTVLDLPRHMLIQHPMLLQGAAVTVVVTDFTLAAARDTIRLLAWLKGSAPASRVILVANKAPAGNGDEIGRKDFETTVERQVDLVVPYDQKLAVAAAKHGKPLVEAGKGGKTGQALARLADLVLDDGGAKPAGGGGALKGLMKGLLASPPKAKKQAGA